MRGEQDRRGRGLVDLARLDADQAILDLVDAADPMRSAEGVQALDEKNATGRLTVERDGHALAELDHDLERLRRRLVRIDRPLIYVARRRAPGIFEHARLDGAAPEV